MGDMADFALEEVMDFEDARLDYRRGELTHEEAVDKGITEEATGAEYPEGGEGRNERGRKITLGND